MKSTFTLVLFAIFINIAHSQTFTAVTGGPTVNSFTSWGNSWVDYDGDNDLDLFINDKDQQILYRNDGNGTFTNITPSNLASPQPLGFYYSSAWGDYDNDGIPDLYIVNDGDKNALFKGQANGTFTQITTGIQVTEMRHSFNTNWVDYDSDGFLDLFVTNLGTEKNSLFKNMGNGTFTKIIAGNIVNDIGDSWCHAWADYNNDGCPDLFVGNTGNDFLYLNNCNGTFTKVTTGTIVFDNRDSQSASWADYDNDGFLDLFVSVWGDKNLLYHNNGNGTFTKVFSGSIVNNINDGTGSAWADYDNDGDLDLYVCAWSNQANRIYQNNGNGTFTEITTGPLVSSTLSSNGCSWADYDNDGDMDLYVTNKATDNQLFNNSGNSNNWVNIRCTGITSNRSGVGAKVRVKATINGAAVWQMREIGGGASGQFAQSDNRAGFGLGNATIMDSVLVQWPSGTTCTFTNVAVNQFLNISENCTQSVVSIRKSLTQPETVHSAYPNPFSESATISYTLRKTQDVTITIHDLIGKIVMEHREEKVTAGAHTWQMDARRLHGEGIYFYSISTDEGRVSGKLTFAGR